MDARYPVLPCARFPPLLVAMDCNWLRCACTFATGMSGAASTAGGAADAAGAATAASATAARDTRSFRMVAASSRVRKDDHPSVQGCPAGHYGRRGPLIPVLPIRGLRAAGGGPDTQAPPARVSAHIP